MLEKRLSDKLQRFFSVRIRTEIRTNFILMKSVRKIRTNFFEEKLTEICLFLTRKIVKTIRTDFSKKTRTSLSSFHWENRTENSYGFFQRKKRTI